MGRFVLPPEASVEDIDDARSAASWPRFFHAIIRDFHAVGKRIFMPSAVRLSKFATEVSKISATTSLVAFARVTLLVHSPRIQ